MRTDAEFAGRLLERALSGGAGLAEVYQKASRLLSVEAKDRRVDAVETAVTFGYGLRVIKDGRLGFSYSNDKGDMERVVQDALQSAGFTERDEFLDLPGPGRPQAPKVFDAEIAEMKEEEAVERALLVEREALAEDARVKKIRKASASFAANDTLIVNSRGVSSGYASTFCSAHLMAAVEEGGDSQMGWEYQGGRFLSDVDFGMVGRSAARRALDMLGARKMTARKTHVVLDSLVATEFLSVLVAMLSSENVQKGKSLLKGRVGQEVLSGLLDIIDDGLLPGGPGTRHVDDEGVPTRRNVLVKNGVLRGFMYNTSTAGRDGAASTGNAVRASFSSVPGVGPMNLFIDAADAVQGRPGTQEMFGSVDSGLYVTEAMGIHTANPISGEFSIGVSGLWFDKGQRRFPVKEAVLSGNMLDFFGKVRAVAGDLRFLGGIGSPSLLVGPAELSA
jgi:PmbA protein